jgi:hypothetical protein
MQAIGQIAIAFCKDVVKRGLRELAIRAAKSDFVEKAASKAAPGRGIFGMRQIIPPFWARIARHSEIAGYGFRFSNPPHRRSRKCKA